MTHNQKDSTVTQYTLGPKHGVDDVELGDIVTFVTFDVIVQGSKTGKVERILTLDEGPRKRAFLDGRNYVLNGYPDSVTDCYLNIPQTPKEAVREGTEKDAFDNFLKVPVGAVFGVDLVGPDSHVWVKVGLNTWRFIDISGSKYTNFEVYEHDDATAFCNLWQEDGKTTFSEDDTTNNWSQDWND